MPAERQRAKYIVRVYRADGLPRMNSTIMGTLKHFIGPQKDLVDPGVLNELIAAKGDLDIVGVAGSHVDDFLLGGKESDPRWIQAREQIEGRFKWKT